MDEQEKLLMKLKEETKKLELRINEYKEIQESIKQEGLKKFEATRDNIIKANCYNGQTEDLQYPLKEESYRNYELFNTVLIVLMEQRKRNRRT